MKILLLAAGLFNGPEIETLTPPPAWRKATRNMMMAAASIERVLEKVPQWLEKAGEETGLVLGSSSGELDTSSEFLMTLSRSKLARPLLFQNSLHNATTGFVSIHFRLTGPTFSMSSGRRLPGESLSVARSLISDGQCGACLVTLVEGHKLLSGFIGQSVGEGAASVLLAGEGFARQMGLGDAPEFIFADWSGDYPENADAAPLLPIESSPFYQRILGLK